MTHATAYMPVPERYTIVTWEFHPVYFIVQDFIVACYLFGWFQLMKSVVLFPRIFFLGVIGSFMCLAWLAQGHSWPGSACVWWRWLIHVFILAWLLRVADWSPARPCTKDFPLHPAFLAPLEQALEKHRFFLHSGSQVWRHLLHLASLAQLLIQASNQRKLAPRRPCQAKSRKPIMPLMTQIFCRNLSWPLHTNLESGMEWFLVKLLLAQSQK